MRNNLIAASVAALLSVSAAHAGGFTAPVVEIEPPLVVTPAPSDWQGAYAGITLGYAFGGDDDIGVRPPGVDIGSAELSANGSSKCQTSSSTVSTRSGVTTNS